MRAQRWEAHGIGGLSDFRFVDVEVTDPAHGEVTIDIAAAGVNPADLKHALRADSSTLPLPIGYEVAGTIAAIGPDTTIGSGHGAVGDAVVAFRVHGGYATAMTVPAADVFAAPEQVPDEQAANLLLAGTTAAEMLHVCGADRGETVLLHGASGAVGVAVLQLARRKGIRVIGTTSDANSETVARFGGVPVRYGTGLLDRVLADGPVDAALDAVGTDEAVDVSLAVVADRPRIVTVAAPARAGTEGFAALAGTKPASAAYRDAIRAELIDLASAGELVVPVVRTYPLAEAVSALEFVSGGHAGGKVALVP
ncbi:NADP-dependent oxidoreductase [Williamsia sp.]|uniref:NADP-dependent oxidoreductase n=1 Tax=Williamsia sp. TaxID=1872085 RepID=UPI001A1BD4D9|nr:NADP-dependent oxidoreductase [Williamsia sp.]MBJ7290686.1 NADP-dependent oxidoreductase [Williamsia sp.]